MPAGIVQVINNTSYPLAYRNTETGYSLSIRPKSRKHEMDGQVPSSNYYDDPIPFNGTGRCIELKLGGLSPTKLADENWQFKITTPTAEGREYEERRFPNLRNGGRYMIRVDELLGVDGRRRPTISILEYDDWHRVESGHAILRNIQEAAPVGAFISMGDIFLDENNVARSNSYSYCILGLTLNFR